MTKSHRHISLRSPREDSVPTYVIVLGEVVQAQLCIAEEAEEKQRCDGTKSVNELAWPYWLRQPLLLAFHLPFVDLCFLLCL